MVEEGETEVEPPAVLTYPTLAMYRVVALVEEYVRVDDEPYASGLDEKVTVQVGAASVQVMVTWPGAPAPADNEIGATPATPPAPTTTDTALPTVSWPDVYVLTEAPPPPAPSQPARPAPPPPG